SETTWEIHSLAAATSIDSTPVQRESTARQQVQFFGQNMPGDVIGIICKGIPNGQRGAFVLSSNRINYLTLQTTVHDLLNAASFSFGNLKSTICELRCLNRF